MSPPARWPEMDSPVKPANDAGECGAGVAPRLHLTPLSPSGLTGGSISPPARWTQRESPVKPANDNVGPTAYTLAL